MRDAECMFSSSMCNGTLLFLGVEVLIPLRDFGVFVLATQLSGVLVSFTTATFLGGVEKRSRSSEFSSSKIRFLRFLDFLIGFSWGRFSSSLEIAVAMSLSASFFTRLSSFFLDESSAATIGVLRISKIGELLTIIQIKKKLFKNVRLITEDQEVNRYPKRLSLLQPSQC